MLVASAVAAAAIVLLVVRVIRADSTRRRQLLPLVAAGILVAVAASAAGFLGRPGVIAQDTAVLAVPIACLIAVLRLRLYDLEVAIGRTAVWVTLTVALVVVYALVVQLTSGLFRLGQFPAGILATAAVAVAFAPLRSGLQRAVAKWLYGARADPFEALAATTQLLAGGADPLGALTHAADDLARRLRCPGTRILADDRVLAGTPGRPSRDPRSAAHRRRRGRRPRGARPLPR